MMMWRAPGFWSNPKPTVLAWLLWPLGVIYGAITAARMGREGERATIPVICIGNFTAGGAGKTPTTLALAALLKAQGETPAIVSRGHGGSLKGPLRVEASQHAAAKVGDEPLMMARHMAVVVARHRPAGVALAAAGGATLALLDDGLQNPSLIKNIRIAVVDGAVGIGNGLCLPAGPMRASLASQWPHVDMVVIIGEGAAGQRVAEAAATHSKPVFIGRLVPDAAIAASLKGQRVLALAAIGRPEKFVETLATLGADVADKAFFADHHPFTTAELAGVAARAKAAKAMIVTTQKDAARIGSMWNESQFGRLMILPVALKLDDEAGFVQAILHRLKAAGTRR